MNVCHSIASISRLAAGVSGFVLPLSRHLANNNVNIKVVGLADKYSLEDLPLWQPLKPTLFKNRIANFGYSEQFTKFFRTLFPSLLHQHGLWMYPSLAVLMWSKKHGIPRVVSPHGMLQPWSWRHHNWKKRPIWYLWEKQNLQTAAAVHVTSFQEMCAVRRMGITAPIAIIPIGVDLYSSIGEKNLNPTKKTMLFLSRLHPVKGLENLIRAWFQVQPRGWQLIIAGNGESGYQAKLQEKVYELGLQQDILFENGVYGEEKWNLICKADVFILPSLNENFGIVIAEALACGVPVITTTETPWQGLREHNCGWWVDVGVKPLVNAITEASQLSNEQLISMGNRGKQYVSREFNWQETSIKMKVLYKWILDGGAKPDFVYNPGD